MNQIFWNSYRRLEKEVLALSDTIHFCDDQIKVYSSKIADLLVRTAIEFESLVKVLYYANGGIKPDGRDLYFDTDCVKHLEGKWLLSKKTITVISPYFYFEKDENKILKPLYNAYKRRRSSSRWQQAYQAVKHDRINNLKSGNIGNLILALGALYILNIYYREATFESVADKDASNVDWGLGSEIFAVKKADYDECIYLVKHTDESAQAFITVMQGVNKQVNDQTMNTVTQGLNDKLKKGEISADAESLTNATKALYNVKYYETLRRIIEKEKYSISKVIEGLKFEAVLNKQQF